MFPNKKSKSKKILIIAVTIFLTFFLSLFFSVFLLSLSMLSSFWLASIFSENIFLVFRESTLRNLKKLVIVFNKKFAVKISRVPDSKSPQCNATLLNFTASFSQEWFAEYFYFWF